MCGSGNERMEGLTFQMQQVMQCKAKQGRARHGVGTSRCEGSQ